MVTFYDKLPDMECLAGDTLPTFVVSVEADSLEGCRMQFIAARSNDPTNAVICKECEAVDEGFAVILTSEDTEKLTEGMYKIHFRLIGADNLSRRKLSGVLYVVSAAKGAD
ncbi:MAG: hypothetical protein IJ874_09140 [Ruminococcus sp.]|nr:hypothetical protein [Ruminococcus sp.]